MDDLWIDELTQEFRLKILDIFNIWVDIGISNEKFTSRIRNLKLHVNNLLDDMITEEQHHIQEVEKSIEILTENIIELSESLQIQSNINFELNESILNKESSLLNRKNELLLIKESRLNKLDSLLKIEDKLCERLYEYKVNLDQEKIPTEQQLIDFQKKINELENLKKYRKFEFIKKRKAIIELCNFLYHGSPKDTMIEIIFNDEDVINVPLSNDFLSQCDHIISQLNTDYENNIVECNKLRERYEKLHCILYPNENINSFSKYLLKNSNDFSNEVLIKLKEDVSILERCRREKLGQFIINYQNQIREKLKNNFSDHLETSEKYQQILNTDEVSESKLEILEKELEKWCSNEMNLIALREEMETWQKLFNRLMEINVNLKDPIILKNRGGILLKVEKEKKSVKKELPKIEAKIRKILFALNEKDIDSNDLRIENMALCDYIVHMWEQSEGEKENEKKDRKIKSENSKTDLLKISTASSSNKKPLKLNPSNSKLIKSDFKKPETHKTLSRIPMKKNVLSPISKVKTNLDHRLSKSFNSLNIKTTKQQLTGSNHNLYAIFCKNVEGAAVTSSFVEDNYKKNKLF